MTAGAALVDAPATTARLWAADYRTRDQWFPLILAVLEGQQQGQILCSASAENPTERSYAVVTKFGFMQVVEGSDKDRFSVALREVLRTTAILAPRYLLWYSPSQKWQQALSQLVPDPVRSRERIRYRYQPKHGGDESTLDLKSSVTLHDLDSETVAQAAGFGLQLETRFWQSTEDLLANGFGTCARQDGRIVGLCYSACVAGKIAEVDVYTDPECREKGLAHACSKRFIQQCLSRRTVPGWDCFATNDGSRRLAARIGFEEQFRYNLYSFNLPLAVP